MFSNSMLDEKSIFKHEQSAIDEIKRYFKDQNLYQLTSNLLLYDAQSNNYYEYDLVLVSGFGIYVVELKHWSGNIKIAPYNWVINQCHYRNDPHKNNIFKCKILKGIYQHHFKTFPDIWVESVVVLTNPDAIVEGADNPKTVIDNKKNNPTFASISDFISFVNRKEKAQLVPLIDATQIRAIANFLNGLNQPKHLNKYSVPGYETIEYISQSRECIELVAKHISGRIKGLKRFRIFRVPINLSIDEKNRFIKKAYNTLEAISQIGDHPNIHKVDLIQNEVSDIIESSDWSETGTLRDVIYKHKGSIDTELALEICYGIALALRKAHEYDVIHRAVKPENILMMNNIPKLMNFDLAYKFEENHLTVIADATKLKDDGYTAPEVLFGQDIDEGTDYFSLGAIAYELLTGVKVFSSVREYVAQGGRVKKSAVDLLKKTSLPENTIETIINMLIGDRAKRLKDVKIIIAAFKGEYHFLDEETVTINPILKQGSQHDIYEIVEMIGEGAYSQVYLAKTLKNQKVVLKLFHKEVPRERIFKEADINSRVKSAYVVNSDNIIGHWKNDRYFMVQEYVAGESLRKIIERGETPDLETFRTITMCLLEGIEAFHNHYDDDGNLQPFLHSDIKPENILITNDKKAVIIDCGIAGEPRIDSFMGTTGYIPPDSIIGTDMIFSQSNDLFALGVTLWEWIFGKKPYENPAIGDKINIPAGKNVLTEHLNNWLLKAVATKAENRFKTITEMRNYFIEGAAIEEESVIRDEQSVQTNKNQMLDEVSAAAEPAKAFPQFLEEKENLFVKYLNSLSNFSAGNENATAESQINNKYFERIHVNNPLLDNIYKELVINRRNIVLTGNAGDGKTTIAVDIFKKVSGGSTLLPPIARIEAINLVIVKDMSELSQKERIELLTDAIQRNDNVYLIISNTGTLLNSFKDLIVDGSTVEQNELLKALKANKPEAIMEENFLIINIGRTDSINTACNVFKRMVEQGNWVNCHSCDKSEVCPIYINYQLISERLNIVLERIELLYRRLYEYGTRLTMRQMTAHLAFALTGGLDCQAVRKKSLIDLKDNLSNYLFFNRFFGDDGKNILPEAMQLYTVKQIRKAGFGIVLDAHFERKIWMREKTSVVCKGKNIDLFRHLITSFRENTYKNRLQIRRTVFFFENLKENNEQEQYLSVFLRSPMLIKYLEICRSETGISSLEESKYKRRIMQVLQEFFTGIRFPEGNYMENYIFITLNRHFAGSGTQMILADFRIDDFILDIKSKYVIGDSLNKTLILRYLPNNNIELELDLPFLDYVSRRYVGEVAEELSAFYADRIERFKVQLLKAWDEQVCHGENRLRLLMIGSDRKIELNQIVLSNDQLEVL